MKLKKKFYKFNLFLFFPPQKMKLFVSIQKSLFHYIRTNKIINYSCLYIITSTPSYDTIANLFAYLINNTLQLTIYYYRHIIYLYLSYYKPWINKY